MRGHRDDMNRHHLRHRGDVIAGGNYMLIGQTYFHPVELRFHESTLDAHQRIAFRRDLEEVQECCPSGTADWRTYMQRIAFRYGDVLGLHFARYNPLTWSGVPCAQPAQQYLVSRRVTTQPLRFGSTLRFDVERERDDHDCRQYSFTAVLG